MTMTLLFVKEYFLYWINSIPEFCHNVTVSTWGKPRDGGSGWYIGDREVGGRV